MLSRALEMNELKLDAGCPEIAVTLHSLSVPPGAVSLLEIRLDPNQLWHRRTNVDCGLPTISSPLRIKYVRNTFK